MHSGEILTETEYIKRQKTQKCLQEQRQDNVAASHEFSSWVGGCWKWRREVIIPAGRGTMIWARPRALRGRCGGARQVVHDGATFSEYWTSPCCSRRSRN